MNRLFLIVALLLMVLSSCNNSGKPSSKDDLLPIADEMEKLLMENNMLLWYPRVIDYEYGGFFNLVTREGVPINEGNNPQIRKNAYGNAFGIYALAAYYSESKDPEVLELAKKAFIWLEKGSHDAKSGGYLQFLDQDGMPIREGMQFCAIQKTGGRRLRH
jgi:mannose/cellobiose epimerase-like protein (N-acyl-D-glucosamine 2-epimerase family)